MSSDLAALSEAASPGTWEQSFYRDGTMDADGVGGYDDYMTPGSEVCNATAGDEESYYLFDADSPRDAAFIVALVNAYRSGQLTLGGDA